MGALIPWEQLVGFPQIRLLVLCVPRQLALRFFAAA